MAKLQLQMLFSATEEKEQKIRTLKGVIADALANSKAYTDKLEEINKAKAELNQIKTSIMSGMSEDIVSLENLKDDLSLNKEDMSVLALEKFKEGGEVIVKDVNGVEYEASFTVKFKKIKNKKNLEIGFDNND